MTSKLRSLVGKPTTGVLAGSYAASLIADMLKANGVVAPEPTRAVPYSLEYLVENALRSISKKSGRVTIAAGTNLFPNFIYPHFGAVERQRERIFHRQGSL